MQSNHFTTTFMSPESTFRSISFTSSSEWVMICLAGLYADERSSVTTSISQAMSAFFYLSLHRSLFPLHSIPSLSRMPPLLVWPCCCSQSSFLIIIFPASATENLFCLGNSVILSCTCWNERECVDLLSLLTWTECHTICRLHHWQKNASNLHLSLKK